MTEAEELEESFKKLKYEVYLAPASGFIVVRAEDVSKVLQEIDSLRATIQKQIY